ncbi:uncharacterized protein LOC141612156 [Silene latifolia]|uniref:uncharacterized protein LOC141612156 n=1 Tax=Silene latifolia TaxID=37657 RepID=UPI003D786890
MDDEHRLLERELYQIQQIRELDDEELQIEEVEGLPDDDSDADDFPNGRATGSMGEFTFDTCLASLHTYLGDVEDTQHRMSSVDSGTILTIPLFYLEGVVLIPEATLPLRIIQRNFILAIERAMGQTDSPYTIGVVLVYKDSETRRLRSATVGTTAEIRQYRRLDDGSVNVVTRGKQRFYVRRQWVDVEGTPCGEVEVIEDDVPLRTPRDAFGTLPPLSNLNSQSLCLSPKSGHHAKRHRDADEINDSDTESDRSFVSELSLSEMRLHQSALESCCKFDMINESSSSDEETHVYESGILSSKSQSSDGSSNPKYMSLFADSDSGKKAKMRHLSQKGVASRKQTVSPRLNQFRVAPRAFWPYWVYQMYDSFSLAKKTADMWKQVVGVPNMDGFIRKPDILSFYIASKIPVSESTRQELLEINGVSYRLRREIELLESFDRVRCKNCQTVIARRSDLLVMSNEGPLGTYVNPYGCVHETVTLHKANGLALIGRPSTESSWFPGYAWTIANCANCERHMGWLFTATNKKLKPKSFWAVRSTQIADDKR